MRVLVVALVLGWGLSLGYRYRGQQETSAELASLQQTQAGLGEAVASISKALASAHEADQARRANTAAALAQAGRGPALDVGQQDDESEVPSRVESVPVVSPASVTARALVDRALARGVWEDSDAEELGVLRLHLSGGETQELLAGLFAAINDGRVQYTGTAPLF